VDNYGTIEPGAGGIGLLTLKNYVASKDANLFVHPASKLRVEVSSTMNFDLLTVDGQVKYNNTTEDFSTSDAMPLVEVVLTDDANVQVGDEFVIMTAKSKSTGDWHFDVKAAKYTWEIVEREEGGKVFFVLRLVSLDNMGNNDNPDNPDNPESTMGAFYDDGINDAEDMKSLRYYANQIGKNVGTAISLYKNDLTDSSLPETTAVGNNFNMLVAENEMKPEAFGGENGLFNFYTANQIVSFANRKKLVMRGHCLVWNQQSPTWISSDGGKTNDKNWTRQQALDIMKSHITNVMQQYKGKVREWDVVNECLDDNQSAVRTNPDAYEIKKNCVWQQAIGDDYIDSAFVYARQADPDAILYLNDYGVEFQGKAKSAAFYNLATRMKNNGIPIDGVGLQCHFSIDDVDSTKLDNTIRRFEEAGLLCIITELDMGIPDTSEKNLMEQARLYRVITDIMLKHDNCPSMVIWGLKDNNSWRETSNPLLFTAQLDKKPAYYAVRSALRHHYLVKQETAIRPAISTKTSSTNGVRYNLSGQKVNADYKGIVIVDGKKMLKK
jgi:GH35 family endo-1,4-beta-xylanase